jgi:hypothetical protein
VGVPAARSGGGRAEGLGGCDSDFGVREGRPQVRMRRSPRPGSTATPHKHTPNFYSDNSNSSQSAIVGNSGGHRSAGPGPVEPEGRRARGSSFGEPALSPGVPGGDTCAGSSRQKRAPRSHKGQTACGAATVRGGASGAGGVEAGEEREGAGLSGGAWSGTGMRLGTEVRRTINVILKRRGLAVMDSLGRGGETPMIGHH